jgi:hypothetical protein
MAASFIALARNKKLKTTVDGNGVHTLVVTAGSAGVASWIEWARNKLLATDMTVDGAGNEIHTLKVIEV